MVGPIGRLSPNRTLTGWRGQKGARPSASMHSIRGPDARRLHDLKLNGDTPANRRQKPPPKRVRQTSLLTSSMVRRRRSEMGVRFVKFGQIYVNPARVLFVTDVYSLGEITIGASAPIKTG